jgi:hypothetical protein
MIKNSDAGEGRVDMRVTAGPSVAGYIAGEGISC